MNWKATIGLLGVSLLAGCTRVSTTTTLDASGSFDRNIAYTITAGAMPAQKPLEFHTIYKLPDRKSGTWKEVPIEGGRRLEIDTKYPSGSPSGADIHLLTNDGKPLLTSRAEVKKLANGNLEYNEYITWDGPPLAEKDKESGFEEALTKILPARYKGSPKLPAIQDALMKGFVKAIVGPPDPIPLESMTNPDFTALKLMGAARVVVRKELKSQLSDLTDQELDSVLKNLTDLNPTKMKQVQPSAQQNLAGGNGKDSDANAMTPMLFEVKFPGKLVETDGITSIDGEVYWSLYSVSAQYAPVQLHLVVNPNG